MVALLAATTDCCRGAWTARGTAFGVGTTARGTAFGVGTIVRAERNPGTPALLTTELEPGALAPRTELEPGALAPPTTERGAARWSFGSRDDVPLRAAAFRESLESLDLLRSLALEPSVSVRELCVH